MGLVIIQGSGKADLSQYATKAELATKLDIIDPTHKLAADLVDDTNETNKFVTTSEKSTWDNKLDALESGVNIKTINDTSILGPGNIEINSSVWGSITGTLANLTDLNNALNAKQDTLTSGANIKTINNLSILGSGNININSVVWGNITGTLSSLTDLLTVLDGKLASLSSSQLDAVNSGITAAKVLKLDSIGIVLFYDENGYPSYMSE